MKALRLIVLAGALVPASASLPAGAAPIERVWNDPEGGSFNDGANWANGVPGQADVALFDYSGREFYEVFFERATSFWGVKVGDEDVAFDLRGNQVTILGKAASEAPAFGLAAGQRAAVRIGGGTLTTYGTTTMAGPADSAADVTLAGSAARWNATAIFVGRAGTGRLEVSGGAQLITPQTFNFVGELPASRGEVLVTGPGSGWSAGGLTVGKAGAGRLEVSGGALLATGGPAPTTIGGLPSSRGEVLLTGPASRWEAGVVLLGGTPGSSMAQPGAQGLLSVLDGAAYLGSRPIQVGFATESTGRVVVSGVNGTNRSTLQSNDGARIGERGTGTLLVQNGARAEFGFASIGLYNGSAGDAIVGGESGGFKAELNVTNDLRIGSFSTTAGPSYTGALTVNTGGAVRIGGTMSIGADSAGTGTVNINGGEVRTASMQVISGQVNLNSGTFAGAISVGGTRGTPAAFTQSGGSVALVRPDGAVMPTSVYVGGGSSTYNLRGGTLRGSVSTTSGGTFNYTGGMLLGNVANAGTFNHTGGGFIGGVMNSGTYAVVVPPAGGGDELTFNSSFRNDATLRVTGRTVRFHGTFTGGGTFFSEDSRSHFTTYDTRLPSSVIIADEGSEFIVSREFWTYSRAADLWDTSRAELHFSGDAHGTQPYYLAISGVDRGATYEGYDQNFAWGALHVDAGKALRLVSPGEGRAIYVRDLLLDGGATQIGSITSTSTRVNLYYDANRPANAYLGGETWFAPGAWIIPVPEPGTATLILPAAWALLRRRSAR